jgi:hypothetical protein
VNDANELSLVTLPSVHPAALHLDLRWVWKRKRQGSLQEQKPGIRGFKGSEGLIVVFNLPTRVVW